MISLNAPNELDLASKLEVRKLFVFSIVSTNFQGKVSTARLTQVINLIHAGIFG